MIKLFRISTVLGTLLLTLNFCTPQYNTKHYFINSKGDTCRKCEEEFLYERRGDSCYNTYKPDVIHFKKK